MEQCIATDTAFMPQRVSGPFLKQFIQERDPFLARLKMMQQLYRAC